MTQEQRTAPPQPLRRRVPSSWSALPRLPAVGDTFAHHYRIIKRLGKGGFGTVYLAIHATSRQPVAIKILNPSLHTDESLVERFRREALLTSSLHHPNTIRVFDYGCTASGLSYLVMEHLQGLPLDLLLRRFGPRSAATAAHITAQVLLALQEAHSLQLIHRDLKPGNIFILQPEDDLPAVKLLDFGVARDLCTPGRLTDHDSLYGTLPYAAPEQLAELPLTPAADLYTLGLILYESVVGASPFKGWSELDIINHKLQGRPLLLHDQPRSDLARDLLPIIAQATSSDHRARYPDADAFLQALQRTHLLPCHLTPTPRPEPPPRERIATLLDEARLHLLQCRPRDAQRILRDLPYNLHALPRCEDLALPRLLLQAEVAKRLGHFGAAEDALRRAFLSLPGDHPLRAQAHLAFADVLFELQQPEAAGLHYLAAIPQRGVINAEAALGNLGLSRIAQHHQDLHEAMHFADVACQIATTLRDAPLRAACLLQRAEACAAAERSFEVARDANALLEYNPEAEGALRALHLLALEQTWAGEHEATLRLLHRVAIHPLAHPEARALLCLDLARAASLADHPAQALAHAHQALEITLLHDLCPLDDLARYHLARCYLLADAPDARTKALELAALLAQPSHRRDDPIHQTDALNAAAELTLLAQERDTAEALLHSALRFQQQHNLWRPRARTHLLLAHLHEPADPWQAVEEATLAVEATARFEAPEQMANARLILGRLNLSLDQPPQARALLEEVRLYAEEHRLYPLERTAVATLCVLHLTRDQHKEHDAWWAHLQRSLQGRPHQMAALRKALRDTFPPQAITSETLRLSLQTLLDRLTPPGP